MTVQLRDTEPEAGKVVLAEGGDVSGSLLRLQRLPLLVNLLAAPLALVEVCKVVSCNELLIFKK